MPEYTESDFESFDEVPESGVCDSDGFNSCLSSPVMVSNDMQLSSQAPSPLVSSIGDLQLSPCPSFSELLELPANNFHMNLYQKRQYIAENRMNIMYNFEKKLSRFKEGSQKPLWPDLGNTLDELITETKLDIVLEASYLYLYLRLPEIHDFTKRLSKMVLDNTKVQIFDESTPEKYQLADHESSTTYREDLALIIRQVRDKRNQVIKQMELDAYKKAREQAEKQKEEAEKQALASENALKRAEALAANYTNTTTNVTPYENIDWEFIYAVQYRWKNETFTEYIHRMVQTKLSRLPAAKQDEWRQSGFPRLVVMGLANYRRVHALFLDLIQDYHDGFDSNEELICWFLYHSQNNQFSYRRY